MALYIEKKLEPTFNLDSLGLSIDIESVNLWNMLTNKRIVDYNHITKKIDLYSFNIGNKSYVAMINGNKCTFLDVAHQSYDKVLKCLLIYFKNNPNIDERLHPLYVQLITLQYIWNHRSYDERGPWYKWFTEDMTDPIVKEYGKYLDIGD